jgi:hypothetical protein
MRDLMSKLVGDLGRLQQVTAQAGLTKEERLDLADELEGVASRWATGRARLLEVVAELRKVEDH